jgi:hypothetical protein
MHILRGIILDIIPEMGNDKYVKSSGHCDRSIQLRNCWTNRWPTLRIEREILQQLGHDVGRYLNSCNSLLTMFSERKREVGILLSHDDYLYCISLDWRVKYRFYQPNGRKLGIVECCILKA